MVTRGGRALWSLGGAGVVVTRGGRALWTIGGDGRCGH